MATRGPEWRHDPRTGRRVLISPVRGERPHDEPECPFCRGREAHTPREVFSDCDDQGWCVRVVPNRYAALSPLDEGGPAAGVAEVFIESAHHETDFKRLEAGQVERVLKAWQSRLRFWRNDGRLAFAQVFKNQGRDAGASVAHCHSQLIGVPFIPPGLEPPAGACAFCPWIASEETCRVFETASLSVVCPPAPRFPGETWIVPKEHASAFEDWPATAELASALLDLLGRIGKAFDEPDLNLIVNSAPYRSGPGHHWRLEVLPKTSSPAGWEWATGLMVNTLFPEDAADRLRRSGNAEAGMRK